MSLLIMYFAIAGSGLAAAFVTAALIGQSRSLVRTLISAAAGFAAGFAALFGCNLIFPSVTTGGIVEIALIGTAAGIAVGRRNWREQHAPDDLRGG